MTLYAVFSDIHANLAALKAVFDDAEAKAGEMSEKLYFICLGDVIDYGPEPNECMALMKDVDGQQRLIAAIQGNHDHEVYKLNGIFTHDPVWLPIAFWTRQALKQEHKDSISVWVEKMALVGDLAKFTLTHATPCFPLSGGISHTITNTELNEEFNCIDTPYALMGHTHLPCYVTKQITPRGPKYEFYYALKSTRENLCGANWRPVELERWIDLPTKRLEKALINPGAVGQPRPFGMGASLAGDIRASYSLLQVKNSVTRFQFRRVYYDPENTTIPALKKLRWQQDGDNLEILAQLKRRFLNEYPHPESTLILDKTLDRMKGVLLGSDILKKQTHTSDDASAHATQKLNDITGILIEDILIPLLRYGTLDGDKSDFGHL
jgi:predicted phosphodiesterase